MCKFYHHLDSLAGLRRGIININKLGFNCRFRLVRFSFLGLLMGIALRGNSCIFSRIFFESGPRCRFCLLTQSLAKRFQRNLPFKREGINNFITTGLIRSLIFTSSFRRRECPCQVSWLWLQLGLLRRTSGLASGKSAEPQISCRQLENKHRRVVAGLWGRSYKNQRI